MNIFVCKHFEKLIIMLTKVSTTALPCSAEVFSKFLISGDSSASNFPIIPAPAPPAAGAAYG